MTNTYTYRLSNFIENGYLNYNIKCDFKYSLNLICLPINIPWIKFLRHFFTDKQCIFVGRCLLLKRGPPFTVVIRATRSSSLLQAFVSQLQLTSAYKNLHFLRSDKKGLGSYWQVRLSRFLIRFFISKNEI